jgi:hypothetical protein
MHCEKNLVHNVIKTVLGKKDSKKVRHDLQALGVQEHFWLKLHPSKSDEALMPKAPWVMHKEEWAMFLETTSKLKLPTRYA